MKRGLFRVWVVASLIWFVGWLWYVWATCKIMEVSHPSQSTPAWERYVTLCYTGLGEWMRQVRDFTFWDL